MRSDRPRKTGGQVRKAFVTGLITLLPLTLTILVFVFLIDFFTEPFLDFVRNHVFAYREKNFGPFSKELITILARFIILIGIIAFTFLLGVVARWFFFRWIIHLSDRFFSKIPFIRTIFVVCKDIVTALFKTKEDRSEAFRYTTLIPFPSKKSDSVGFVTGSVPSVCNEKVPNLVPVFVPTSPHPISGYLMLVPKEKAIRISLSKEDAVKLTVSCGMIIPDKKP